MIQQKIYTITVMDWNINYVLFAYKEFNPLAHIWEYFSDGDSRRFEWSWKFPPQNCVFIW